MKEQAEGTIHLPGAMQHPCTGLLGKGNRFSIATLLLLVALDTHASAIENGPDDSIYSIVEGVSANGKTSVVFSYADNYIPSALKYTSDGDVINIGTLGGRSSTPLAISADGTVTYGSSVTANGETHAFKHTDAGGIEDLGILPGAKSSHANAASANGSVIVGTNIFSDNNTMAFRYTDDKGMKPLGTLGGQKSEAVAISEDGAVITGNSNDDKNQQQAFKYIDDKGMQALGTLGGTTSLSVGVSADGTTIIGESEDKDGRTQAYKHTDAGGMIGLGHLGAGYSQATAVSANGDVVVGNSQLATGEFAAFKHADSRGMVDIGNLGGYFTYATGVSANGVVTVGSSSLPGEDSQHAYKHTNTTGMVDLGTLGGKNSSADGVSGDGSVIYGWAETENGIQHAALWKNDILVDASNTHIALAQTAQQATQVLDMRSAQLQMLMQQDCSVGTGDSRFCIGAAASYSGTNNARSTAASFTLGYQITPQWRIGTTINQSLDSSLPSEYKSSNNLPGIGVFTTFNARKDGLGWQARVAAAYQKSTVDINRKQLSHTESGVGRADLDGKAASVEGSYRLIALGGTIFRPYAALRYSSVSRDAYSEKNGIEFIGRYAEMGRSATSFEAGLRVAKALNDKFSLSTDISVSRDISVNNRDFKVGMDYVGGYSTGSRSDKRTRARLGLQGRYALAANSAIHADIYWSQQAYGNSSTSAQLSAIRQF
jgi:probable HAF family extracellular repeat protein